MTWLYIVVACAAVVRWSLWYLRDVIEWAESPRRDYVSAPMRVRLRLQRDRATRSLARMPVVHLPGEVAGGPRGA